MLVIVSISLTHATPASNEHEKRRPTAKSSCSTSPSSANPMAPWNLISIENQPIWINIFHGIVTNPSTTKAPQSTPSPDMPTSSPWVQNVKLPNSSESVLAVNGYPAWILRRHQYHPPPSIPPPNNSTTLQAPTTSTIPIPTSTTKHKSTVCLPYHTGTTEIIEADVGTISISKDSLRHQLVHLKDKLPRYSKSGIVYHGPCAGKPHEPCDAHYIGETEQSMEDRFKEHHNKAKR
jgi:hypothetical protein